MAADPTDPFRFTLRSAPPTFDLEEGKDRFKTWKERWEAFLDTSGLGNLTAGTGEDADDRRARIQRLKRSTLIGAALSEDTVRAVNNMAVADPTDADSIIRAIQDFILGETNETVYAYELFTTLRPPAERIETFAISIRDRAAKCGYPADAVDRITKDAFVITVNDDAITEKLMQQPSTPTDPFTFSKAVTIAQSVFGSRANAAAVRQGSAAAAAARVDLRRTNPGGQRGGNSNKGGRCGNCGLEHRTKGHCPAKGKVCLTCGKENHFAVVCRSASRPGGASSRGAGHHQGHHNFNRARAAAMEQAHDEAFHEEGEYDSTEGATSAAITMLALEIPYITAVMGRDKPDPLRPLQRVALQVRPAGERPGSLFAVNFLPDPGSNITAHITANNLPTTANHGRSTQSGRWAARSPPATGLHPSTADLPRSPS
jgi:hypothetical protein